MKKFIFLISACLCVGWLHAQWTTDYATNTLITTNEILDQSSVGTASGKTYITFTADNKQKLQLLDKDGNKLFGETGMVVNNVATISSYTLVNDMAVLDEDLYLAFVATGSSKAYAHKIASDGTQLFGETGIDLGNTLNPRIAPLPDGGAIIGTFSDDVPETQLMKYNNSGTAVWETPSKISIPSGFAYTVIEKINVLSDGSFIAIFHAQYTQIYLPSTIYAQRFDTNGNALWAEAVPLSNRGTSPNSRCFPTLMHNDVVYLAYYSDLNNRFDTYLQRINADGSLPWGINGTDFSTDDSRFEFYVSIAKPDSEDYIWAIANLKNSLQSKSGEFVQRFDINTGARQMGDNAKELFPISDNMNSHLGDMQLKNDQPIFIIADEVDQAGRCFNLSLCLLDAQGDFAWSEKKIKIATFNTPKSFVNLMPIANQQAVVTWQAQRQGDSGPSHAYAQNYVLEPNNIKETHSSNDINIYPNPSYDGIVNIQTEQDNYTLQITDASGHIIQNTSIKNNTRLKLDAGIYFLRFTNSTQNHIYKKLIVL